MAKTKKKSVGVIVGAIIGLVAVVGASIGIATAVRQANCQHVWDDGTIKTEATCSEEGKMVFKCEECGKRETEKIEKLSHTWKFVEAKAPTCTEDGHTEYTVCEVCEEYKNDVDPQVLLALGHTEVELSAVEATCTETGLTAGKYCTTCEQITVEQRTIAAKGHTIVALEAKAPTCEEAGLTAGQKCSNCDFVYAEQNEIPATGHIDEDEDFECDICEDFLNPTANMVERQVAFDSKVAGKWYSIYYTYENKTVPLSNVDGGGGLAFTYRVNGNVPLTCAMLNFQDVSDEFIFIPSTEMVEMDYHGQQPKYIDFYVPEGYIATDSDSLAMTITSETAIGDTIDIQGFYELVENE